MLKIKNLPYPDSTQNAPKYVTPKSRITSVFRIILVNCSQLVLEIHPFK